ncbi:hypothetical protein ACEN30_09250 [Marinilactibacillus psychrotolerans]|uniref:hypothetical protein n=1 Tax=Marinilactibacillus psychrotolerans TaxID=191770 RepID=UPI00388A6792
MPLPTKPNKTAALYTPKFSMMDHIIKNRKQKLIEDANKLFEKDLENYEKKVNSINDKNNDLQKVYDKELKIWFGMSTLF